MNNENRQLSKEQIEQVIQLFNSYMDDYMYIMDLKEDYYRISKHATERFMVPSDSFGNAMNTHLNFVYEEDREMLNEDLKQIISGEKKSHNLHYRWLDKNGKPIWINCRGGVIEDAQGKPRYLIGCINETGKKQRADNTSGLLGELELMSYIKTAVGKENGGFVMCLGIDDFSAISGSYGTEYSNYIIKNVVDCINVCMTGTQHLYHISADEYMIVDFEDHSSKDAIRLYKDIRQKILEFIDAESYKSVFTISAGIIESKDIDENSDDVLRLAEFTLKQARDSGNNNFFVFNDSAYESFLRKRKITMELYRAVDNNFEGFEVNYQPIVNSDTSQVIGAEALMRFSIISDQGTERIAPFEFIPILEESGLIIPAGRWILDEAVSMCSDMQQYIPDFKINVNISYIQVLKSNVLSDILSIINKYDLPPQCIGIELTESGYFDSNPHFYKLRKGLKENGILFIIDDFGTGYSNLHCLSDLNPTYIKIDRDFTNKAMSNMYDHELMVRIIEMAHSIDLGICVEGVEETQVLEEVRKIHADYIQGYLFGKPCSREDFYNDFVFNKK